jgi:hypothetical protein
MGRIIMTTTILCLIAICVAGKSSQSPSNYERSPQTHIASASATSTQDQRPSDETQDTESNAPRWCAALKRPDWWLVVVAVLTALAVGWQAFETRRSAKAMQKSTELQEVQNRQWLDIENWRADAGTPFPSVTMVLLGATFDIVNPTKMPLTLRLISVGRRGEKPFDIPARRVLAPRGRYPVIVPDILPVNRLASSEGSGLNFAIVGTIKYIDAFEHHRDQPFGCMCVCTHEGMQFNPFDGILPAQDHEKK